jgi:signal transduction histidine kinase
MNGRRPFNSSNTSSRQESDARTSRVATAVGFAGLAATAALVGVLWGQASAYAEDRLTSQVTSAVDLTSTALATVDAKLVSLSALFRASVLVTVAEFQRFTADVGIEDGMAGIGYVTTVDSAGLAGAEALLGSQSGAKVTAFELDGNGMPSELGSRDLYHLVQYVSPGSEWSALHGLDLGSLADVEGDLDAAVESGGVAMTQFITLPGDDDDTFLMLRSVTSPATEEHVALVVALMDFSELLESHIPAGVESYLEWHFEEVDGAATAVSEANSSVLSNGGRDWMISVSPTDDSPFGPDRNGAFVVLLLGIIATSLAVAAVHLYRQRVDGAVQLAGARQSTDAKVRFIAAISHELRTPLTAVLGFAEILKDGGDLSPAERYSMMKAITEEATDLAHIIDDLLVAARGEIGQVVVAKDPVAVRDEVEAVVGASGLAERVVLSPPSGDREVALGDASRVRQILRNLLENAHRYGGTSIEIEIATSGRELWVEVRDDGSGVPASILSTLFEPYQHAGGPTGVTESLGLGLSVSSQLAQLMDGELVHERKGDRTVFRLTLPVHPTSGDTPETVSGFSRQGSIV